jgi:hypothetical protein
MRSKEKREKEKTPKALEKFPHVFERHLMSIEYGSWRKEHGFYAYSLRNKGVLIVMPTYRCKISCTFIMPIP